MSITQTVIIGDNAALLKGGGREILAFVDWLFEAAASLGTIKGELTGEGVALFSGPQLIADIITNRQFYRLSVACTRLAVIAREAGASITTPQGSDTFTYHVRDQQMQFRLSCNWNPSEAGFELAKVG
jgi:hypothetical protein